MKIDTLRLDGFRSFEQLTVSFDEQLTVFIAKNGQGKTTILDAIAIALAPFVRQFEYGKSDDLPKLKETDVHRRKVISPQNKHVFTTEKSPYPAKIISVFSQKNILRYFEGKPEFLTIGSNLNSKLGGLPSAKGEISEFGEFLNQAVYDGQSVVLPVVAYYGTGRLHAQQRLSDLDLKQFTSLEESRTRGYYECLSSTSNYGHFLYGIKVWAEESYQQYLLDQQGEQATSYYSDLTRKVMDAIQTCLEDDDYQQLRYSPQHQDFVINTPNGVLLLSQLSDGMRNVITMVGDIAYRLYALNPWSADEIEGIVLIDEIEMHLHPSWQQTILGKLMKAFSQVQFIVTTHSPQVISTVRHNRIRIIEGGEVRTPSSYTHGLDSANVMATVMGVDPLPIDLEINQKYLELLDRISREKDTEQLKHAIEVFGKEFGTDHPSYLKLRQQLRLRGYNERLAKRKNREAP